MPVIGQAAILAAVIASLLSGGAVWWMQSSRVDAAQARAQLSSVESDRLRELVADRDTVIARQSRDLAELTHGVGQCAASIDRAKADADKRADDAKQAMELVVKEQQSARDKMARLESKLARKPTGSCEDAITEWRAGR